MLSLLKAIANQNKNCLVLFNKSVFKTKSIAEEIQYQLLTEAQKELVLSFFSPLNLKENPNNISFYQQKLVLLCSVLHHNPQLLFIDHIFDFLTNHDRQKFNEYFKKQAMTVVLVSNKIEYALDYPYMIVMHEGKIAIEGWTKQVLKEEKLLKRLGIGLPFYIDLSIQLNYYNLIDTIYDNKKDLGDHLWK